MLVENPNELAEKIYKEKYYIKDLDNNLLENCPEDVFKRLASFIATVEPTKSKQQAWSEKFFEHKVLCLGNREAV